MQQHKAAVRVRRGSLLVLLALLVGAALPALNATFVARVTPHAEQTRAGARAALYPYTDVNPYGANTFLSKEVEDWKRERTVQMMADAGIGWIKQQFPWSEIEPKPGRYWDDKYNQNSWEKYDRIVALAEKYGLRVIARLDNTPEWAGGHPGDDVSYPPTDPEAFANFVATFVEHYRGRVQYLQIWNEPNLKQEWGGKIDPAGYALLLRRAYARAKQVDPNVVILSAPLAQTLEQGDRGLDELDYLQRLYDNGFAGSYDILFANGYGLSQPPEAEPGPQVLNFRRVELVRDVMVRNGEAARPMWLNEYGWNAAPADLPAAKLIWGRVTDEQQARYTIDGIRYAREHWPWMGVINIWFFRQVGDIPRDDAQYYFGMVDFEFTPRPVYRELQRATADLRLALPGQYGVLDPALVSRGQWSVVGDREAGTLAVRSDRPNDQVTVHFRGTELSLTAESGPQGGRLGVVVDNSTALVEQLPRDDRGRRYIDFRADTTTVTNVPVVTGLDPLGPSRDHTAVLTVLPTPDGRASGAVTLTGLEVGEERPTRTWTVVLAATAVLVVLAIAMVARTRARLRRGRSDA